MKHFLIFLLIFCYSDIFGQAFGPTIQWLNKFDRSNGNSIIHTKDGGYLIAGENLTTLGMRGTKMGNIIKTSPNGELQWQKIYGGSQFDYFNAAVQTKDSGYIVIGSASSFNGDLTGLRKSSSMPNYDVLILKLSKNGDIQWQKCFGGSDDDFGNSIIEDNNGNYVFCGSTKSIDGDVAQRNFKQYLEVGWVVKISGVGDIIQQKCFGGTNSNTHFYSIATTLDGSYILNGDIQGNDGDINGSHNGTNSGSTDAWVVKLSQLLSIQWQKPLGGSGSDIGSDIKQTTDGGFIVLNTTNSNDGDVTGLHGTDYDIWVVKLSSVGKIEWQRCVGSKYDDEGYSIIQNKDGGFVVVGYTQAINDDGDVIGTNRSSNGSDGFIAKLSAFGKVEWSTRLNSTYGWLSSVIQIEDGGFVTTGYTEQYTGGFDSYHFYARLIKFYADKKLITGFVEKSDSLCSVVDTSKYVPYGKIKIDLPNSDSYFANSDSIGRFKIYVDTSQHSLSAVPLNSAWAACAALKVPEFDTITQNAIQLYPKIYPKNNVFCPVMKVELTSLLLRRCFESQYTINYGNYGTAIKKNAQVELTLDSLLQFVSTSLTTFQKQGNKIIFPIGDVDVNHTGRFIVTVKVDCNSPLGQIHCTSVFIPKNSSCDSLLDTVPHIFIQRLQDSLQLSASKGVAMKNATLVYKILRDSFVIDTGRFFLTQTQFFTKLSLLKSYRLELYNLNNQLVASKNIFTNHTISLDFNTTFPENLSLSNEAEFCAANRSSLDPNAKTAIPFGIGVNHYIEKGTNIEYLVQFQNTGNDTAFTVIVKDTLSPLFDYTTFDIVAASHFQNWQINPQGVLTVTFNKINLVDSVTNEKYSHGFLKYRIRLKDSIPNNTRIENKAAIYFDFNSPVITNTSFHTIGKDFLRNCTAKPTAKIIISGCPSKTLTLSVITTDAGANPTYNWFQDKDTVPFLNSKSFTLGNTKNGSKYYCKITTSSDVCTETPKFVSDTLKITCVGTPTDEQNVINSFSIYPNPNNGIFDVRIGLVQTTTVNVSILNLLGQVVKTAASKTNSDNFSERFNLTGLPSDIYYVRAQIDNQNVVRKLFLE